MGSRDLVESAGDICAELDRLLIEVLWPEKMREMGLSVLSVFWYDTEEDDPVEIERQLLAEATYKNGVLPPWNNQLY